MKLKRILQFSALTIILSFSLVSCKFIEEIWTNIFSKPIPDKPRIEIPNQMIVSFPEGTSQAQKEQARKNLIEKYRGNYNPSFDLTVKQTCQCDTLELWESPIPFIIIEGHDGNAQVKPPPVGGQGDGISVEFANSLSYNYEIDSYEADIAANPHIIPTPDAPNKIGYEKKSNENPIKIAIMDTGFDTTKVQPFGLLLKSKDMVNCPLESPEGSPKGSWNFLKNNNNVYDDHIRADGKLAQHGTWVTQLLLEELGPRNVQIVSMKVLDEHKRGTLFSLLCAINYAIHSNVKAINMSLGYYGVESTSVLLRKYMQKLADAKIWVFASAGNESPRADSVEKYYKPNIRNIRSLDERDFKFYPACLSSEFDNIITITSTQLTGQVCDTQNFSPKYVNVGEKTDAFATPNSPFSCGFYSINSKSGNNRNNNEYLAGSSFATPIFAGKFLKTLQDFNNNPNLRRKEIIKKLKSAGTNFGQIEEENIINR